MLGRSGAAVKVKGMFLHPRQAAGVLDGVDVWRFVVDRVDHKDRLTCEVVIGGGADAASVIDQIAERIRVGLRFSAQV